MRYQRHVFRLERFLLLVSTHGLIRLVRRQLDQKFLNPAPPSSVSYSTTPWPLPCSTCLPKERIVDLVVLLVIKKMVTLPAHTKNDCFVSHIIIMQESAQVVVSSDCDKLKEKGRGGRGEGKEERNEVEDASSFIKLWLAWLQRSPPQVPPGFEKSGRGPRMFYTLVEHVHQLPTNAHPLCLCLCLLSGGLYACCLCSHSSPLAVSL